MDSKLISLCIVLIHASVSCQKDEKSKPEQINGKWEWVKTIIPFNQEETNPQSEGFSIDLEFVSDGTIKEYKNGLLTNISTFSINKDQHGNLLQSTIITSHFYFVNDTLIFNEAYVDGPVLYYKRLR